MRRPLTMLRTFFDSVVSSRGSWQSLWSKKERKRKIIKRKKEKEEGEKAKQEIFDFLLSESFLFVCLFVCLVLLPFGHGVVAGDAKELLAHLRGDSCSYPHEHFHAVLRQIAAEQ